MSNYHNRICLQSPPQSQLLLMYYGFTATLLITYFIIDILAVSLFYGHTH